MSKALLYAVNENSQTIVVGDRVNFGSPVRRYGNNVNTSGGNVIIQGEGYYDIDATVTFVAGAAGVCTITLLKDGTVIPGATAVETVADGDTYTFAIPSCAIREKCCCESTITAVVTGVIGTITNATILVVKE